MINANSTSNSPRLSIIIPALNEDQNLDCLFKQLREQSVTDIEIILADGASTDESKAVAEKYGVCVVDCPRNRGAQMNKGSLAAKGEFLLFLHADSQVRDSALIENALSSLSLKIKESNSTQVAGHFPLKFVRTSDRNPLAWRYIEEKTHFNRPNTTNGDQGFLLSREFFDRLGGFSESLSFLEDQILAEKIRSEGVWITLPGQLYTSARRFETEGLHRLYILMSIIMGLHSTKFTLFFERAPNLYRTQMDTDKLMLTPFFNLIWSILKDDLGLKKSMVAWQKIGRYIRHNSWQGFYFFDILLRPLYRRKRYPLLKFHDVIFWPCTNFRACDTIVAVIAFVWFMGVLKLYFSIAENEYFKRFSADA